MEWISVKDRLPPYLRKCLVTNGDYVLTAWSKDEDPAWCGITYDTSEDVWIADVTHWMLLPDPPKE